MATMTATKEAPTKPTDAPVDMGRRAPVIPAANMKMDLQGHMLRSFLIRLPEGFVRADLMETEHPWRKIQAGGWALRKHDRIYAIAYDESWIAEAIVSDASQVAVTLAKPAFTELTSRIKPLFSDDTYRVQWAGNGYVVIRIADHHAMTQPVASEALATRELSNLYPRPLA